MSRPRPTRLKSKVFSLERLYKVCVQKNCGSEKKIQKKLGPKKNFGLNKKRFGSEKILGPERFWFKSFFGTNKILGLKILGLKENFWSEKMLGPKKF